MTAFKVEKNSNYNIVEFNESDNINDIEVMHLIGIFKESHNKKEKLIFRVKDGYVKQKLIGLRFHRMGVEFETK